MVDRSHNIRPFAPPALFKVHHASPRTLADLAFRNQALLSTPYSVVLYNWVCSCPLTKNNVCTISMLIV